MFSQDSGHAFQPMYKFWLNTQMPHKQIKQNKDQFNIHQKADDSIVKLNCHPPCSQRPVRRTWLKAQERGYQRKTKCQPNKQYKREIFRWFKQLNDTLGTLVSWCKLRMVLFSIAQRAPAPSKHLRLVRPPGLLSVAQVASPKLWRIENRNKIDKKSICFAAICS